MSLAVSHNQQFAVLANRVFDMYAHKVCYFVFNIHFLYYTYIGAELVLRHIRNGVELNPIDLNRNYDFNF